MSIFHSFQMSKRLLRFEKLCLLVFNPTINASICRVDRSSNRKNCLSVFDSSLLPVFHLHEAHQEAEKKNISTSFVFTPQHVAANLFIQPHFFVYVFVSDWKTSCWNYTSPPPSANQTSLLSALHTVTPLWEIKRKSSHLSKWGKLRRWRSTKTAVHHKITIRKHVEDESLSWEQMFPSDW